MEIPGGHGKILGNQEGHGKISGNPGGHGKISGNPEVSSRLEPTFNFLLKCMLFFRLTGINYGGVTPWVIRAHV